MLTSRKTLKSTFLFQRLDAVVSHRLQQFTEFRRMIALRAKYFFVVLLENRQYTGKMTFNHKNETLEMFVSTQIHT